LRPGVKDPFEIAVTRRRVTPPAVLGQMIDRNIGYIKLYSFRSNSYYEFHNVLKSLKNNGMTALIIDLRDNPGGLLAELRYFLSTFFPPDTPFLRASYRDSFEIISTSKAEQIEKNIPIVVLINEDSASAAEVAAATFSEYRRAVLVGNRTAGAVEISTYLPLPGYSLMSITIARIRTGKNGVRIEKIGVSPDIYVELTIDDIDIAKDTQLERAIEEAIKLAKIK
jgi:carboxyl-terminal processing protease